jgi:hypothetical protein
MRMPQTAAGRVSAGGAASGSAAAGAAAAATAGTAASTTSTTATAETATGETATGETATGESTRGRTAAGDDVRGDGTRGTARRGTARRALALAALLRRHWLAVALVTAGLVLRVITQLAYNPALLYIDTPKYLANAWPGADPVGYKAPLALILLAGNLSTVAAVQHLLGLAMAITLYLLLQRRGVHRALAALAIAPVLLDAYQLQIEQTIMPDVWFEALIVAGLAILLWAPAITLPAASTAGLLLGSSATVRQVGEILILPALAYLLAATLTRTTRAATTGTATTGTAATAITGTATTATTGTDTTGTDTTGTDTTGTDTTGPAATATPGTAATGTGRYAGVAGVAWRRAGVRAAALCAGFALPILAYCTGSYALTGQFSLSNSSSTLTYARMAGIADCAALSLPAAERPLCPTRAQQALGPDWLDHDARSPLKVFITPPGLRRDQLISDFSHRVLAQQPLRVLTGIARDAVKLFAVTRAASPGDTPISRWEFQTSYPTYPPAVGETSSHVLVLGLRQSFGSPVMSQPLATSLGGRARVWRPAAAFLRSYQLGGGYTPGPLLALAALAGLAGSLALLRRRASTAHRQLALACLLFFGTAAAILLASDIFEFTWRYQLPALITLPPAGALGIAALLRYAGRRITGRRAKRSQRHTSELAASSS